MRLFRDELAFICPLWISKYGCEFPVNFSILWLETCDHKGKYLVSPLWRVKTSILIIQAQGMRIEAECLSPLQYSALHNLSN